MCVSVVYIRQAWVTNQLLILLNISRFDYLPYSEIAEDNGSFYNIIKSFSVNCDILHRERKALSFIHDSQSLPLLTLCERVKLRDVVK